MADLHTLAGFKTNTTYIHGLQSLTASYGTREVTAGGDGTVYPTFAAIMSQSPRLTWSTVAVKTALDAIGVTGTAITSSATGVFYFRKIDGDTGLPATGSVHRTATLNMGMIVPSRLTMSQGSVATISYDVYVAYDGSHNPIIHGTSAALETDVNLSAAFTQGTFDLNGSILDGVQSVTIDFGINVQQLSSDGDVWPTKLHVASIAPNVRVQLTDSTANIATLSALGTGSASTDSVAYLQKLDDNGNRVAAATEEHISFTFEDWLAVADTDAASTGGIYTSSFRLIPAKATNAIIVIDTTAAMATS